MQLNQNDRGLRGEVCTLRSFSMQFFSKLLCVDAAPFTNLGLDGGESIEIDAIEVDFTVTFGLDLQDFVIAIVVDSKLDPAGPLRVELPPGLSMEVAIEMDEVFSRLAVRSVFGE